MAFTEDRRHQRHRLDRALRQGIVVLLDRSFYSTLAYQGSALPPRQRRELEKLQHRATIVPDRVVLLTLPLRLSETRRSRRGGERAPTERLEVLRRASRAYRQLAKQKGWIVLDARRLPQELVDRLDRRLTRWVLRRVVSARERA
jgi:dTMP kinase